jgi:hypothetical protein
MVWAVGADCRAGCKVVLGRGGGGGKQELVGFEQHCLLPITIIAQLYSSRNCLASNARCIGLHLVGACCINNIDYARTGKITALCMIIMARPRENAY